MKLDLTRPIVICRSASPPEPLAAGFTLGYACAVCALALQTRHYETPAHLLAKHWYEELR